LNSGVAILLILMKKTKNLNFITSTLRLISQEKFSVQKHKNKGKFV
jgi:hypothetical protein